MNIATAILGPRPAWHRPEINQPAPISLRELTELGTDWRGRTWYRSKYGELVSEQLVDEARQILPNSLLLPWVDPNPRAKKQDEVEPRYWHVLAIHAPGTFEQMRSPNRRRQRPAPVHRPIDALGHLHVLAGMTPGRATMGGFGPRNPIRGPEAILARLAASGAMVSLSTDRGSLVVQAAGGRPAPGVLEIVKESAPLLLAHLQGEPLRCNAGKHKGEAPAAVTVVVGGAVACRDHMDGAA